MPCVMMRSLYRYRYFVLSSIKNDVIHRYARSRLGIVWNVLNPLALVLIYAFVFSNVMQSKFPNIESKYGYTIYLISGLMGWNLFSEILLRSTTVFIDSANLIKKMSFPISTLPLIVFGIAIINFFFLSCAIFFLLIFLDNAFSWSMLWLVPVTLLLSAFSLSLGTILGMFNVFVRDIGQAIPIILQMTFWVTPIVYPVSIIPEWYSSVLRYNPIYLFIDSYHRIMAFQKAPHWANLLIAFGITLVLMILCLFLFRRAKGDIQDGI